MKRHLILIVSMLFVISVGITSGIFQSRQSQGVAVAQTQSDGAVECHNFSRNGKKPNCVCYGQWNPDNPPNPECKPPSGEDPHCTNHCKKELCKCKPKCQS